MTEYVYFKAQCWDGTDYRCNNSLLDVYCLDSSAKEYLIDVEGSKEEDIEDVQHDVDHLSQNEREEMVDWIEKSGLETEVRKTCNCCAASG